MESEKKKSLFSLFGDRIGRWLTGSAGEEPDREELFRDLSDVGLSSLLKDRFSGLWTNLQRATQKEHLILQITSAQKEEGKTTIAFLGARTLASSNLGRFLLIDTNIYHPSLSELFQVPSSPGLLDVLEGDISYREAVTDTTIENLQLLTIGGPLPLIQAQMLIGRKIGALLEEIHLDYDCMILDAPSIVLSTLPETIGAFADGTILVVKANSTRREVVQTTIKSLEQAGIAITGIILNERTFFIPDFVYRHLK